MPSLLEFPVVLPLDWIVAGCNRERAQVVTNDAIARSSQLDARERELAGLAAVLDGR